MYYYLLENFYIITSKDKTHYLISFIFLICNNTLGDRACKIMYSCGSNNNNYI